MEKLTAEQQMDWILSEVKYWVSDPASFINNHEVCEKSLKEMVEQYAKEKCEKILGSVEEYVPQDIACQIMITEFK